MLLVILKFLRTCLFGDPDPPPPPPPATEDFCPGWFPLQEFLHLSLVTYIYFMLRNHYWYFVSPFLLWLVTQICNPFLNICELQQHTVTYKCIISLKCQPNSTHSPWDQPLVGPATVGTSHCWDQPLVGSATVGTSHCWDQPPWDQPLWGPATVGTSHCWDQSPWDQPLLGPATVGTSHC